jgi:ribonucleoside-diphosphate reductase beta chain
MTLTTKRSTYKPFHYPQAYDYWMKQQNAHWLHSEISLASDMQDWKLHLTEEERAVVGGVLKGFVQAEIIVNDYWTKLVGKWFPHPEVVMMATAFGNMETVHTVSYAYLNDTLGLENYEAFLEEPSAKAKIDRLLQTKGGSKKEMARSLAVFSGFTEGVSLFSSFAILLNFSRFNKLKGVGQIISFSIRDESLHSEAGCWLFREFIKENPEIWDDELKRDIYEAARATVALEDAFIDSIFGSDTIEGLSAYDLKQFIRQRANVKLGDLGLKMNWKNIDQEALERMSWFSFLSSGVEMQDFFANRVSAYSKGVVNFDDMF